MSDIRSVASRNIVIGDCVLCNGCISLAVDIRFNWRTAILFCRAFDVTMRTLEDRAFYRGLEDVTEIGSQNLFEVMEKSWYKRLHSNGTT